MTVADEDRGEIHDGCLGSDGPLAPNGTGHVTEHRIREHANAVEIDKDGRMAEKRQPITHAASSWISTGICGQPGGPGPGPGQRDNLPLHADHSGCSDCGQETVSTALTPDASRMGESLVAKERHDRAHSVEHREPERQRHDQHA